MSTTTLTGNDYRVFIGKETALGSGKTNVTSINIGTAAGEVVWLPDTFNYVYEPSQIDTGSKSTIPLSTPCELKAGHSNYKVTLSGYFSDDHEILLKALTGESASTYDIDGLPTLDGYVIERVWSDVATSPFHVDKAVGCQLQQLKITGQSGDLVRYEATFTAQNVTRETTQAFTGTDPGVNCTEGYNFGDVTGTLNFGDTTHLKSFSITLTNEMADDATQYQNSNTILSLIPVKVTGELNYVTNYYSTATDKAGESKVYSATPLVEVIKLNNGTLDMQFTMNTQVTSYTLADPDKALFENNVTSRLIYTNTGSPVYPLSVATS